jgi:biopolymer transport protein TolR
MRPVRPQRIQSAINVTPLVDVVLVLLIIFMVMAPQMRKGKDVDVPETTNPREQGDERSRIIVTIDDAGGLWIDDQQIPQELLGEGVRAAAGDEPDPKVVIKADARLNIGEIRQAMLAIEAAGFRGVGLVAKRTGSE